MKTLRDTAQREIDEQLVAIKAMRANEAAAMIARNLSRTTADASQVRSFFSVSAFSMAKFIMIIRPPSDTRSDVVEAEAR